MAIRNHCPEKIHQFNIFKTCTKTVEQQNKGIKWVVNKFHQHV